MKIIFFVNKSVNSATARFRGYLFSKKLKESYTTKVIKIDEIYNRYEFNFSRLKNNSSPTMDRHIKAFTLPPGTVTSIDCEC